MVISVQHHGSLIVAAKSRQSMVERPRAQRRNVDLKYDFSWSRGYKTRMELEGVSIL